MIKTMDMETIRFYTAAFVSRIEAVKSENKSAIRKMAILALEDEDFRIFNRLVLTKDDEGLPTEYRAAAKDCLMLHNNFLYSLKQAGSDSSSEMDVNIVKGY